MYQETIIVGNLGNDPQTFDTQQGPTVTLFSVKTERSWNNADGSQGKQTVWFMVSVWGKLGETCQQFLTRGRRVLVEGDLIADPNTGGPRIQIDGNGRAMAWFEIGAKTIKFLDIYDDLAEAREVRATTRSSAIGWDEGGPRCPACGSTMDYSGIDEHFNQHIWTCTSCDTPHEVALTREEMEERGDFSYLEDWEGIDNN